MLSLISNSVEDLYKYISFTKVIFEVFDKNYTLRSSSRELTSCRTFLLLKN